MMISFNKFVFFQNLVRLFIANLISLNGRLEFKRVFGIINKKKKLRVETTGGKNKRNQGKENFVGL